MRSRPDSFCSRPRYTVLPFHTDDHAALPTSSTANTATSTIAALGRARASRTRSTAATAVPPASNASRTGCAPTTRGTPSQSPAPAPIHAAARRAGVGRSIRLWIPSAPRTGITRNSRYRSRLTLCRYTSPYGSFNTRFSGISM